MFVNRQDAESVMVVGLAGRRDSPTNGDKAYFRLDLNDSDNGPTEFTCIAWPAVTTTAGAEDGRITFYVIRGGQNLTRIVAMDPNNAY